MATIEVKVPNIGDFKGVEVIEVLVNEGQDVKKNDGLITIESDKSSVEIPSTHNGKIKNLKLKVGITKRSRSPSEYASSHKAWVWTALSRLTSPSTAIKT